jgi:steroid delta-isomerase-like uncharacterized protein
MLLATTLAAATAELARRLPLRFGGRLTTMPDENKRVVRRSLHDLLRAGRLDLAEELFAPEWVGHDVALPAPLRGREGVRRQAEGYRSAFPDLDLEIEGQIAEADCVCTRWTARGTHRGDLFGIPATQRSVAVEGVSFDRLRDGRIVESRTTWDTLGLMQQLGAVTVPARAPEET